METIIDLVGADGDGVAIGALSRRSLTYAELRAQIDRIGRQLRAAGVGPSDRVAMVLGNGPAMASAFVCMAPWCATAPLNPAYKADEFDFYLADLGARALVVEQDSDSAAVDVARARDIPVLRLAEGDAAGAFRLCDVAESAAKARSADAVALILHTSGTTSRPKMVPLSQANLAASARNIAATLCLDGGDRCLNVMPLFHIHGLMAPVLASLTAGAEVVCTPGFDALRFFAWLDASKPTWYSAVPTMHQAILARAGSNRDIAQSNRLRFIRSSSASLPAQVMAELERVFAAPVIEAYAMTEAAHQMCSNPLPPGARKPGYVGPAAGPQVAIMNADGELLPTGDEGEIVIRGANVTSGYLGNPSANASAFHRHPGHRHPGHRDSGAGDNWFRTGDQGVMDAEGYLKVTGRLKEIINRGGEKIAPLEVDDALLRHDAVRQACAFAMPHQKLGEDVAAAVVLADGADVSERELRDFVGQRLADFKTPRRIVFVDEIPKGATGKIQRIGLAKALGLQT